MHEIEKWICYGGVWTAREDGAARRKEVIQRQYTFSVHELRTGV